MCPPIAYLQTATSEKIGVEALGLCWGQMASKRMERLCVCVCVCVCVFRSESHKQGLSRVRVRARIRGRGDEPILTVVVVVVVALVVVRATSARRPVVRGAVVTVGHMVTSRQPPSCKSDE